MDTENAKSAADAVVDQINERGPLGTKKRTTRITVNWADGEYAFNLGGIKPVRELEEKCNTGIGVLFQRITGQVFADVDIRETIRCGLIGAGMPAPEALKLVKTHVDDRPRFENLPVARAILYALMIGVDDEDAGEPVTAPPQ
jgi:hypothetical protein